MSKYYVYCLRSLKDNKLYIGFSSDVIKRLKAHNSGKVRSTRNRRPFKLIYKEGFADLREALLRERYLKSGHGREYLRGFCPHSSTG